MKLCYILNNHFTFLVLLVLLVAFILRLMYCFYFPSMPPDSMEYYTAAINIVNGNGYSRCTEAPFFPFYYREPLTSYSFAMIIWIMKCLFNIEVIDYPNTYIPSEMQPIHQYFTFGIRLFSIALQLISLYLFMLIIKRKTNKIFAVIFLVLCALYFPLIENTVQPLREPYVFFFCSLFVYFWILYLEKGSRFYIAIVGFVNGILCLYLQVYWLLAIFAFFIICLKYQTIKCFFRYSFIYCLFLVIPLIPHLYRVYNYYPDIRVLRTLGTALTFDVLTALDAYHAFGVSPWDAKDGDLPNGMKTHSEYFDSRNASLLFERTFDGTFKKEAERVNNANSKDVLKDFYVNRYLQCFRNTIFLVGITYDYGVFQGHFTLKDIFKFLFVLPYLMVGIIWVCGLWIFVKRYWMLLPIFFFHIILFFAFGSEERRQVMIIPYLICIVLFFIWNFKRDFFYVSENRRDKFNSEI